MNTGEDRHRLGGVVSGVSFTDDQLHERFSARAIAVAMLDVFTPTWRAISANGMAAIES